MADEPLHADERRTIDEPKMIDELQGMAHEPLLPIEKKLILYSLGLGVVLLGILLWLSRTFFPG